MINISKIYVVCIYLSILVLPMNSLGIPYVENIIKGVSKEAAFYPLFIGVVIWSLSKLVSNKNVVIPKNIIFKGLLCFITMVIISSIVNIISIYENDSFTKIVPLILSLFVYILIVIYIYNSLQIYDLQHILNQVHKMIIFSFILAGTYSLLELGRYLGIGGADEVRITVDSFLRAGTTNPNELRIHSLCLEPSFFAVYASFVYPWLFTGAIFYKKTILFCLLDIYFILLVFLSGSRTIYITFLIETLLLSIFYKSYIIKNKKIIILSIFIVIIGVSIFFEEIYSNVGMNINIFDIYNSFIILGDNSSTARYATQVAGFYMFLDNPFFGVGLGQYSYNMRQYMPDWGYDSTEIANSFFEGKGIIHGLFARILGEIGVIGFIVWCFIWMTLVFKLYKYSRYCEKNLKLRVKNIIISFLGIMFYGFLHDSFAIFSLWIMLGISLVILNRNILNKE